MKTGSPLVSSIVLNYLNYDQTIRCAHDLLHQDYPNHDVIIVDNHSPNESAEELRSAFCGNPRVCLLQTERNLGYSGGNNHGAKWRLASGVVDYFLIANSDVHIPDPTTVTRLVEFAQGRPDVGVVGPKVVSSTGFPQGPYARPHVLLRCLRYLLPFLPYVYRLLRRRVDWVKTPRKCYAVVGAFMLLKARPFAEVGMFDEHTFLGAEEYILAEKLRHIGLHFCYFPTVTVVHVHSQSAIARTGGELRYFDVGLESMSYYFREYRGTPNALIQLFRTSAQIYSRYFLPWRGRFGL